MEGVFDQKVKEKIARLKESEINVSHSRVKFKVAIYSNCIIKLEKQQEAMRMSLEKEERELEEKRLVFLKEKQRWEDSNREDEEKLKHSLEKE